MHFRLLKVMLFVAFALLNTASAQVPITGDWQGVLDADGTRLHLVLHVTKESNGTFSATVEVVDQNKSIAVKSVDFDGKVLRLDIERINGTYVGEIAKHRQEIKGVWTERGEGQRLTLRKALRPLPRAEPIGGDWEGVLSRGRVEEKIRLHINTTSCTNIMGTFNGPIWLPELTEWFVIKLRRNTVHFSVKSSKAAYSGTVETNGNELEGIWRDKKSYPLKLHRVVPRYEGYAKPIGCIGPAS